MRAYETKQFFWPRWSNRTFRPDRPDRPIAETRQVIIYGRRSWKRDGRNFNMKKKQHIHHKQHAPVPHVMSVHAAKPEPESTPVIHTTAPVIVKVDAPKPHGFWNWVKRTFWQD